MTATKTFLATALIALGGFGTLAFAQTSAPATPDAAVQAGAAAQKSRAEVLADLEIYRESGLALVDRSEQLGFETAQRQQAEARYRQLRQSPAYAALVKRYTEEEAGRRHVAAR